MVQAAEPAPAGAQVPGRTAPPEKYRSAVIDSAGNLAITTTDGRTVIVPKAPDQTAFSPPVVSPDQTAVGAQAMFANCCTSYDLPLQLVVHAGGSTHRFTGTGVPMFRWGFADSGTTVAYGQETAHFSCFTHYELREVVSERLIEAVDVPQPCGEEPNPRPVRLPAWVRALIGGN